jgi:hypothetical protein
MEFGLPRRVAQIVAQLLPTGNEEVTAQFTAQLNADWEGYTPDLGASTTFYPIERPAYSALN